jgi:F420H(2)-dependent quinone reductase
VRDSAVRRWSAFHKTLYRLTRGLVGSRLVNNDMLLLTTRGQGSGRDHTVPLLFLADGERLVVIASYGGRSTHPDWYRNLIAEPRVVVQVKGRRVPMLARKASPAERLRLWPSVVAAHGDYAVYQSRTDREIPVVLLEPE